SGVMIGRAAMENPWIFGDAKYYLLHGAMPPARAPQEKTNLILRHARMALESRHYGDELHTMRHMRSRILAYTKGFPGAKEMRSRLVRVSSMSELEDLLSNLPGQKP
ncbi:tRNA-dihydrouridine synthase, partial [uncultured Akkermansia sp.]